MIERNPKVDAYLIDGCGRCALGGTANCKVNFWKEELKLLRRIAIDCGLQEEVKWDVPCYTYKQHNILIIAAFKENCTISFFKGALLQDAKKILIKPGEHTQAARLIRFTNVKDIEKKEALLKAYIFEAIEIEKAGLKVNVNKNTDHLITEEFSILLNNNPALKKAFYDLTPGRQRAYLLYFSQAKQSATRKARIEKYIPTILAGKGFTD